MQSAPGFAPDVQTVLPAAMKTTPPSQIDCVDEL